MLGEVGSPPDWTFREVQTASCYIYVYFRPDGSPCYVGKGSGNRWVAHERRPTNKILARIIAKAGGELPKVKIRTGLTDAEAFEIERALIKAIGRFSVGGPLVNMTDGGDGVVNPSDEARQKLRDFRLGRPVSKETRRKMSASHKGKRRSPEHQAAISAALRGLKKSPAHIAKLRQNKKGAKLGPASDQRKEKVRAASLAYWAKWKEGGIERRMRNGKLKRKEVPSYG